MKRTTYILGGLAAFAALWSAGWFAGKALYVEPEADLAVERMRAGSLFFAYERRAISGFPFGYDIAFEGVSLSDAGGRWRWRAPAVSVSADLTEGAALLVRPAAESRLTVEAAAFGAGGAEASVFDVASEGLVVTLEDGAPAQIVAARIEAIQAPGGAALSAGRLRLVGVEAKAAPGPAAGAGSLGANEAEASWRFSPDRVSESRAALAFKGLSLEFEGAALDAASLSEFFGRDGIFDLRIAADAYEVSGETTGSPSEPPLSVSFSAGAAETVVAVRGGRAAYAAQGAGARYAMRFEPPAAFPGGEAALDGFEMRLDMPLRPGPAPGLWALSLALRGFAPDPALWAAFDPAEALGRAPMSLEIEAEGAARVSDLDAPSPGGAPVSVETVRITKLALDALGLEAGATAALDLAGNAAEPRGEVALELKGALALLDRAARAGLLAPEAAEGYRDLLSGYGRAGEGGPDHLLADIRVGGGRMEINGRPLE